MATTKAVQAPTSVEQWKKEAQGIPLPLPSGKTCLVRNVGMQVFLQRGLIPNSLMPLVKEGMKSGKGPELNTDDITDEMLADMIALFDAATVYCVVQPDVQPAPAIEGERLEDVLYVDEVDFEDKQFIFQFVVGGTRDLERFREEQGAVVEHLRSGATVEQATE